MLSIEGSCEVSVLGETTLPKSVRQRLNLAVGGLLGFRLHDQSVCLHPLTQADQRLLALAPFLSLLDAEMAAGDLPELDDPHGPIIDLRADRADPRRPIIGQVTL
jgi:bifunctional DNA-binding transcriptional regulator/antitoxin component of YhaV-PrlF toxin-antitoxin module